MHFYRRPFPVHAMSFDLDDTLYDNRPVIDRVEREMVRWLHTNHPISATLPLDSWKQLKQDIATANPELKHDVTLWRQMQIKHGLIHLGYSEPKAQQASELGIKHALWLRNQVTVPDNTHRVMAELAKHIPLVAITNGNVDPSRIGLGDYFQLILKAGPDGRSKPFGDMFRQATHFLGVPPGRILHVGDHLKTDVMGAIHAGFQACWINDQQKNIAMEHSSRLLPHIEISTLEELLLLV